MADLLSTPFLRVDGRRLRRNVARMAEYAERHGLRLRPHTKTHKSRFVARLQVEAGARGLTVAKAGEGEVMADVDRDILLAYPAADEARARRAAELARTADLKVAVDTSYAIEALDRAARAAGSTIGILVDLDVGMHRTGVPTPELTLELARTVQKSPGLRLDGLFCYPGHVRAGLDRQAAELGEVQAMLAATLDLWRRDGIEARIVSGGSTPTAVQTHLVPACTEFRPGTYVYNDLNTAYGGHCTLDDCAATIVTTVVSDAVAGKVVVDAGSKTLTMDPCLTAADAGHGYVVEYPAANVVRLSEEHGEIDVRNCDRRPKVGEQISIIPNHVCPCVNLQDRFALADGDGDRLEWLPVDSRGRLT